MKGLVSEDTKVLCHCDSKTQKFLCQLNKSLHQKDVSIKLTIQALALHGNLSLMNLFHTKFWVEFCPALHIPHQEPSRLGVIELNLKSNHHVAIEGDLNLVQYITFLLKPNILTIIGATFQPVSECYLHICYQAFFQCAIKIFSVFFLSFFFRSFKYWRWKIQRTI